MTTTHLDRRTLQRLLDSDLPEATRKEALVHLRACDHCWERAARQRPGAAAQIEQWMKEPGRKPAQFEPEMYAESLARARDVLRATAAELREQKAEARQQAHELMAMPFEDKIEAIESGRVQPNRALVDEILTGCRATWAQDAPYAEEVAEFALVLTDRMSQEEAPTPTINDLFGLAWAYYANCRRIRSDFRAADHAFHTARFYVDRGTGDPLVRAEVSDLYATCCRLQQRYDKAIGLLHEAAASYAEVGDRHRVGRVLFKKTLVLFEMDHIAESSDLLERVVPLIDIEREPRLALNIQHQRTQALHQAGRSREALDLLPETRRLAEQYGSRIDRVRLTGVEGAIMTELGDFKLGEKCLREAIDGFLEEGIGYEAAFFSLELAALYLRQGRTGETRQLALEIAPIFESKDIHSEALAALMIFQKAAELEAANVTLAQEISRFLNRARHSPQLHYEPGT